MGRGVDVDRTAVDALDHVHPGSLEHQLGEQHFPRVAGLSPREVVAAVCPVPPQDSPAQHRIPRPDLVDHLLGSAHHLSDPGFDRVCAWFHRQSGLEEAFRGIVRESIDDVLDGGRTARYVTDQLSSVEKTFIGTRVEIRTMAEFYLGRGKRMDALIAGEDVDVKWSLSFKWMIPTEAVGEICLLIGGNDKTNTFEVGLLRCSRERLSPGPGNKDKKLGLTREGRAAIHWLVPRTDLPPNFLATLDDATRTAVMSERRGQPRVTALFNLVQRRPIPRLAIETVACQRDPMRRVRRDKANRLGDVRVLGGKYGKALIQHLGVHEFGKDDYVSFPEAEVRAAELDLERGRALPTGLEGPGQLRL